MMKVILAADHRGFALKEELKKRLSGAGYELEDIGALAYEEGDDYPDFAAAGAKKIAEHPEESRGIFICGSGMGMDVAANKLRNVRATVAYSPEAAVHARTNDNVNVITIAADVASPDEAYAIASAFLSASFSSEDRHIRRLQKISALEEESFK
jgi:RpiB/LacA/LacB family sugar-phosphate isomerase